LPYSSASGTKPTLREDVELAKASGWFNTKDGLEQYNLVFRSEYFPQLIQDGTHELVHYATLSLGSKFLYGVTHASANLAASVHPLVDEFEGWLGVAGPSTSR